MMEGHYVYFKMVNSWHVVTSTKMADFFYPERYQQ